MTRILPRTVLCAALAAAAPGAFAQDAVVLYGLMDMSVGSFQNPGADSVKRAESGKMTTSFLGFRGSEDLGGGLTARFAIEHFLRLDSGDAGRFNGDAYWARSAYAALAGGFGTVAVGRNTTSLFVQTLAYNAFGDSFGFSPSIRHYFTSGTTTGDTGWSDSLRYLSPKFGNASATAHVALGEASGGRNTGVSAQWGAGAISVGGAWQKVEKGATVADTTTWQLAGSYDFGAAKLFAQYGQVKNETVVNRYKISGIGVAAPVGLGRVLAQYGEVKPDTGAKLSTLSLGYDHFLSKRTDIYLVGMKDRRQGVSDGNSIGLGVRHRF